MPARASKSSRPAEVLAASNADTAPPACDLPRDSFDALPIIEPACALFRRKLKAEGLKYTPERAQMLETVLRLGTQDARFTADRIFADVRAAGFNVSKATMYRTLKLLIDARIIERALSDSDQTTFRCTFGEPASPAAGKIALLRTGNPPTLIHDATLYQSITAACEAWCRRQGVEYAGCHVEIHAR
jgi:Fe2+ or Zn2+ uptake regulation protein